MRRRFDAARVAPHLVVAAAGVVAAALVPLMRMPGSGEPFLTFAAFVLVTELLDTELPSGRRLSLSLAPALGFAILEGGAEASSQAPIVGLTFLAAAALAGLVRTVAGREVRLREIAVSFLTVTAAAAAYDALAAAGPIHLQSRDGMHLASGAGLLAVLAIALAAEPVRAAVAGGAGEQSAGGAWRVFRRTAPLQTAIVSVAALVALAFPKLGGWSFPLFLGPLAATRYAFRQITAIRTTEVQTLRALSEIPEMAGYTRPGHSRRVAELAVAMAAELGVTEEELRDVEYAALLHDIGRVVLEDPDAERAANALRHEVALTGANIVAAAGTFPRVARMIREQHKPYRRRGETTDGDVPLGARILKVANTFDDRSRPGVIGHDALEVMEHLHQGKAYDFDPDVVAALVRVLERDGTI